MILKQVIRYTNAAALEATWVRHDQLPDIHVAATPALYDADGKEVVAAAEAHTVPGEIVETVLRSHAYHATQMAELRADLGPDAAQYEPLIQQCLADYVPPPPPVPVVPRQITRAQGKAALIVRGLWAGVLAYVAAISDPTQKALAEVALNDTLTWDRSSPFLVAAAEGLGLSSAELDALFVQASEIAL
jgi:hypothetical protein